MNHPAEPLNVVDRFRRAIGFRGADRWRERLAAASFDEGSRAAAEVRRVLAHWM